MKVDGVSFLQRRCDDTVQQADIERVLDYGQREYSDMRHSISDGMSSVRRQLASSYDAADGYGPYGGSTVYTSGGPPSGLQVAAMVGLAVGGVGLLIFFIVLCCVCCKHKSGGRVIRAPPAASAPNDHVHEHHNPLSYAGAAPPSSGPALYLVPPGPAGAPPCPATVPPGAYLGPALAPYALGQHQHAVAPDQPPAYDSERPLLSAGDSNAKLF